MKSLYLIRHAKSSWENFTVPDFDRPLNDRGKRDAPVMAQRMVERAVRPELLLISAAKRTRKTAEFFMNAWKMKADEMQVLDELYHASPDTFRRVIEAIPASIHSVAIFSHNNGITDFANQLTTVKVDNMPTCGIFAVQVKTDDWQTFSKSEKEFLFFDFPKNL